MTLLVPLTCGIQGFDCFGVVAMWGSHEGGARIPNNMTMELIFNSEELIMTFYFFSLPQFPS